MKRAMTMFVCVLAAGIATAQSPTIIQNTRAVMDGVRNNATKASNDALGITGPGAVNAAKGAAPAKAPAPSAVPSATAAKSSAGTAKKTAAKVVPAVAVNTKAAPTAAKPVAVAANAGASAAQPAASTPADDASKNPEKQNGKWPMTGKRDPFVSPVVYQTGANANCSGGKKCLEIGAINLRGVVRSESGFIAVVTNSLNKAYFLRENDPVFDGYVVKITGDSIVFQETLQDRLGKTFTREVVKKITTPSV